MSNKYVMDMYARTSYAPLHEKYEFTATAANNYARNHNAPTEWLISNCHEGSGGYYEPFCWLSFDEYSRMSRDIQMWYAPASAPDEWWDTQKSMVAKLRRLVTKGCTIDELVTTVGSGQMGPDIDRLIFEYRGYHRYLMRDVVRILARRWLDHTGEPGSLTYHRIVADMYA